MLRELPPIIIDTREQLPYEFKDYPTVRAKLDAGDYSLQGYEQRVAVERKSLTDAYQCTGASRRRFQECLERLSRLDRAAVVIESSMANFVVPPERTHITGRMAIASYLSWSVEYGVYVYWAENRLFAERVTLRFLAAFMKWRATEAGAAAGPATRSP